MVLVYCDDKAKFPIGEHGVAVTTGVRGKQTIAPTSTNLESAEHDVVKSSLAPSLILQVGIPENVDCSFVKGKVEVTINESVFEQSNPSRHATSLSKFLLPSHDEMPHALLKYRDVGTDHHNTLESVKCASIRLCKEMNLHMLILAPCAPGQSWCNLAERYMSLLNLVLQN
jgi:hypothetical protein